MVSPHNAKKAIAEELARRFPGKEFKLTARTIDFTDLARDSCVFVKIHGWQPHAAWSEVRAVALANGFRVEAA